MKAAPAFNAVAPARDSGEPDRHRRPATRPFSIRLTDDERGRLQAEAKGVPLGAYMKAKLLGGPPPRLRRSGLSIEDRSALGRALALLGQSRLASNLNQLARLAHIGALPVTEEIGCELHEAVEDVRIMRASLLRALGLSSS